MIFGKHINRYYLRYAPILLVGLAALILVDYFQLEIPVFYRLVINGINERWKFQANRKAVKEDRAEEKADKTDELTKTIAGLQEDIKRLRSSDAAQSEALKQILLDRVLYLGQGYIAKGEISYDDRRRFHAMHDCYHKGLGGNGDADIIVEGVDALPLKK